MKTKAIIFDLDGTIADTIGAIAEGVNLTMEELELPTHTDSEVRTFINFGPRHLISEAIPESEKEKDPDIVDKALEIYNQMYAKTYIHTEKTYDGMSKVISTLSKKFKTAILSNKQDEYVKALAEQLLPSGSYLYACGSLDGIPAKPSPIIAHRVTNLLKVLPEQCVLVGDSQVDIDTARNAGFDIVSVSWGYTSKEALIKNGARIIVDTPQELLEYFMSGDK